MMTFATVLLLALANPVVADADACLKYEPAVVTLHGQVSMDMGYGAPNFGDDPEHDEKEYFPRLRLKKSICVESMEGTDPNLDEGEEDDVTDLQLVYLDGDRFDHKFLGKQVVVTGKLFRGMTGHHHTKVLMVVERMELAHNARSHSRR